MTTRTAETSPLIYARVAGLRAPQVIKPIADMIQLYLFIKEVIELL